jgi:Fic family protein
MIEGIHKDILLRTSAFLLLKDSKASFTIEGETPSSTRARRWGMAIGQAGSLPLSKNELLRLQQLVIENDRFIKMGFRAEGGFIGEHDRSTGEPIPDHISARWEDIESLIDGLLGTNDLFEKNKFHPVLAAACVAFGFVFIHPFVDGNGRIHRYLIHHLLARMNYTPQGIIFPVSAAILERITDYRKVLETYSQPILEFIQWKKTGNNNIEVLNNTIDYYRYFDATPFTEFIFTCIEQTIDQIIPREVNYLRNYDTMKSWLDDRFEMPDKMVAMLIRFLEQNNGKLSIRAREKEFKELTEDEALQIEKQFMELFNEEKNL